MPHIRQIDRFFRVQDQKQPVGQLINPQHQLPGDALGPVDVGAGFDAGVVGRNLELEREGGQLVADDVVEVARDAQAFSGACRRAQESRGGA